MKQENHEITLFRGPLSRELLPKTKDSSYHFERKYSERL